jgi:hypothetical protein
MGILYSEFVDPQVLTDTIGADYLNQATFINSGAITRDGLPKEGSQMEWIKQTIFSGDTAGQTVGVGTEIDLKNKVQTDYALPIVWRADGAELDDISEDIMKKSGSKEGAEADASANLGVSISEKAGQMIDDVAINILDGSTKFIQTDANNYQNDNGSQVSLKGLEQCKSTRGENGKKFEGGFMVMRGLMYHQLAALGLIAATSNTMGNMKQDELVRTGILGSMLGMNIISTDKISLDSGGVDHLISLIEAGSLKMKMGGLLNIDPVIRGTRSFTSSIKFKVSAGGIMEGLSWSAAKVNPATVTNTVLATGTNYEQAATNIKNVPMAVYRCDAPSFA